MCGFTIRLLDQVCFEDRIAHRGLKKVQTIIERYTLTHFKLPFQTLLNDGFDQPIKLSNGNYLLFNGEIFNIPSGFKNDVDYLINFFSKPNWLQEVVAGKEYQNWDGFWAIAIVNEKGFYCFTDPLGKKQLYWANGCISSEIKPLLSNSIINPLFDKDNPVATEKTPFIGIKRILPNCLYKSIGMDLTMVRPNLFDLRRHPKNFDIKNTLKKAVESRLVNLNGSATLLVSGGLDSSIILENLYQLRLLDGIELLTIQNQNDEFYISILEDYYDKQIKRIDQKTVSIQDILKAYEYPIEKGSLVPQWLLCEAAGNRVIITGDGADELFSGYNRALKSDTQEFDVFTELPFYHNIRLDRIGMAFTKEIRSPFMSHDLIRMAVNYPYDLRKGKQVLKKIYENSLPKEILNRPKEPLRIEQRVLNKERYDQVIHENFEITKFI